MTLTAAPPQVNALSAKLHAIGAGLTAMAEHGGPADDDLPGLLAETLDLHPPAPIRQGILLAAVKAAEKATDPDQQRELAALLRPQDAGNLAIDAVLADLEALRAAPNAAVDRGDLDAFLSGLKRVYGRAEPPPSWWTRRQRVVLLAGAASFLAVVAALTFLLALLRSPAKAEAPARETPVVKPEPVAAEPEPPAPQPPDLDLSRRRVVVIIAVPLDGQAAVELETVVHGLILRGAPAKADDKSGAVAAAPVEVAPYRNTPGARVIPAAVLGAPGGGRLLAQLNAAGYLEAEYACVVRPLSRSARGVRVACEIYDLRHAGVPVRPPEKGGEFGPPGMPSPRLLMPREPLALPMVWCGDWTLGLKSPPREAADTTEANLLSVLLLDESPLNVALAAEAIVGAPNASPQAYLLAAAAYRRLADRPYFAPVGKPEDRSLQILRAGYARYPNDERIVRLLAAIEPDPTRRSLIAAQKKDLLTRNEAFNQFGLARSDDERAKIVNGWLDQFITEAR